MRPDTQDRLRDAPRPRGQPSTPATCPSALPIAPRRRAAAPQGRRRRRRTGGPVGRARSRAARLRRHGLRSGGRAGRDDALRHPRVPPAAHADPRRDRQDPRARRDAAARTPASSPRSASPSCARRDSRPCSSRSACRAAATSQVPGVELDGVVKAVDYLLNVNRGYRMDLGRRVVVIGGGFVAFDAARTALRLGREEELARARPGETRRAREGSARLGARGACAAAPPRSRSSRSRASTRCRCSGRTQGHEEFEEAQREGVAFITRRGPTALPGRRAASRAVELRARALGLRRDRPLRARATTTTT